MAASMAREFVEGWTLAQTLGEGAYGEVKLLINRVSGEAVAMKMVDLIKHPDAKDSVRKEVCIQKMLKDTNVLRYFGQRTAGDLEYIFLEYAAGGELFDRIEPDMGMDVREAQRYFKQLLSGVAYLHSRGVAHRDLKPENLLLDENDVLKISDFGMATMFRMKGNERLLDKRCGTLPYVAPEVLVKPYNAEPADIWSCGIILIAMLGGELPWDQPTKACVDYTNWIDGRYASLSPWIKLDNLVLSLLKKILTPDIDKRLLLKSIIEHRWCTARFSQDKKIASDAVDGINKRHCSTVFRDDKDWLPSRLCLSQPEKIAAVSMIEEELESRNDICFSQPILIEDLFLSTQLNPTQGGSQNAFQKLVKRMTRFFVSSENADTLKRLCTCLEKLGFTWKANEGIVTISTVDRRNMKLVFKANIIDMDSKIMVDFRLSKGCGLEFKRLFVKIKENLSDVVVKGSVGWPS